MSWIVGMSTVHRENKKEFNKSQQSSVYMDNTENRCLVHCTRAGYVSRHTRTRAHSLKQTNKQIDRRPPSCGKGCQMASLVVVSEDETGKAPSVGLREIILVCTDLPTKQLITAGQEEQGARCTAAFSGNEKC